MAMLFQFLTLLIIVINKNVDAGQLMPGGSIDMSKYRDQILQAHNTYRSLAASGMLSANNDGKVRPATNMREMIYDLELERSATVHADKCLFSSSKEIRPFKYGENLFIKMSHSVRRMRDPVLNVQSSLNVWFREFYLKNKGEDCENEPNKSSCSQSTRILWAKTDRVGCAISKCSFEKGEVNKQGSGEIMVCHYYPKNDVKEGKPNSEAIWSIDKNDACKEEKSKTHSNLCKMSESAKSTNICILEQGCSKEGTESCQANKNFFTCKCKDGYIGDKCNYVINPYKKDAAASNDKHVEEDYSQTIQPTPRARNGFQKISQEKEENSIDSLIRSRDTLPDIKHIMNSITSRRSLDNNNNNKNSRSRNNQRNPNGMITVATDDNHNKKCLSIQTCLKTRIACKTKLIDCDLNSKEEENSIIQHRQDNSIYSVHYDRCLQMGDRSIIFKKCTGIPDQKFKFKNGILSNMQGSNCVAVTNREANWAKIVPCDKLPASQIKETGLNFYSKFKPGEKSPHMQSIRKKEEEIISTGLNANEKIDNQNNINKHKLIAQYSELVPTKPSSREIMSATSDSGKIKFDPVTSLKTKKDRHSGAGLTISPQQLTTTQENSQPSVIDLPKEINLYHVDGLVATVYEKRNYTTPTSVSTTTIRVSR